MDNQYNTTIVLTIAIILILAGAFVAILTGIGTFEKAGFEFLSGFDTYLFGMTIAITLLVIGFLLLFFGLH